VISLKNVLVGDFNGDVGGVRTAFISAVEKSQFGARATTP